MEKILIAKVLRPQGLAGEVKCKMENNDYSVIENVTEVYLQGKDIPTRIKSKVCRNGYLYLTLGTIDCREKADLIRGFNIYAERKFLNIPDDEFMVADLIGATVVGDDGTEIGKLVDIQNFGATDIFVIKQYGREYMVPFIKDIVTKVNVSAGIITVNKSKYNEAKICD